jgi:penicillin-binding protein 1A
MLEDGYITPMEAATARDEPLVLRSRSAEEYAWAPFFTEEIRRQLVERYGEEGFYEGGLSVRTTVDPRLQAVADRALRDGLAAYERRYRGWRGPLANIDMAGDDGWQDHLEAFDPGFELLAMQLAVVIELDAEKATIGLSDGTRASIPLSQMKWARREHEDGTLGPAVTRPADVVARGDIILVEAVGEGDARVYALRQRPAVEGAVVAINPHTGQVLALSGGFSFRQSQFNRATQALRQPGSSFKPFVYLAALENGYTPASIVLDAPITIDQGPGLPKWRPENYSERFYGPSTLRLGIEKSRNLMTVRLALDIGMDAIIDVARRFGIDRGLQGNPASALGSNEVTPLSLTTAYAMLVNGGKRIEPYIVERIQDRRGQTIFRRDTRACECTGIAYDGGLPPELSDEREQVADPRLAYQMVSMLQGVVERGTASAAKDLGRPLAGKTGTTNDSRDAWFVGFSPDLVVGVYVGYDQPKTLGDSATGSSVALPIWIEVMREALEGQSPIPFRTPPGLELVQIDADTGRLPSPETTHVIAEAFLPGTEPASSFPRRGYDDERRDGGSSALRPAPRDPVSSGGLY